MNMRLHCPNCYAAFETLLPIEPHYTLGEVMELVRCSKSYIMRANRAGWLSEPVYIKDETRRYHRMYPASDVRALYEKRYVKRGKKNASHKAQEQRPNG